MELPVASLPDDLVGLSLWYVQWLITYSSLDHRATRFRSEVYNPAEIVTVRRRTVPVGQVKIVSIGFKPHAAHAWTR